jgi:hypothetical protein
VPGARWQTGTVVVNGYVFAIVTLELREAKLFISARHDGPMPPCQDAPATVFGADGLGFCQSWNITIPPGAEFAHDVWVQLPIQITQIEVPA